MWMKLWYFFAAVWLLFFAAWWWSLFSENAPLTMMQALAGVVPSGCAVVFCNFARKHF